MAPEEYQELSKYNHKHVLDEHEIVIVSWLEKFPDLSAAQIQDRLLEHYQERYSDRTVRRYTNHIRTLYPR